MPLSSACTHEALSADPDPATGCRGGCNPPECLLESWQQRRLPARLSAAPRPHRPSDTDVRTDKQGERPCGPARACPCSADTRATMQDLDKWLQHSALVTAQSGRNPCQTFAHLRLLCLGLARRLARLRISDPRGCTALPLCPFRRNSKASPLIKSSLCSPAPAPAWPGARPHAAQNLRATLPTRLDLVTSKNMPERP